MQNKKANLRRIGLLSVAAILVAIVYFGFALGFRLGSMRTSLVCNIIDLSLCLNSRNNNQLNDDAKRIIFNNAKMTHQALVYLLSNGNVLDQFVARDGQVAYGFRYAERMINQIESTLAKKDTAGSEPLR